MSKKSKEALAKEEFDVKSQSGTTGESLAAAVGIASDSTEPHPRTQKTSRYLRHDYTDQEMKDLSKHLNAALKEKKSLESTKKSVMSDYKARIDYKTAELDSISLQCSQGWEDRDTECTVYFNTPKTGMKRVVRDDSGEIVEELAMTKQEMQEVLPFPDPDAPKEEPKGPTLVTQPAPTPAPLAEKPFDAEEEPEH